MPGTLSKQLALNADMIRLYLNGCGRNEKPREIPEDCGQSLRRGRRGSGGRHRQQGGCDGGRDGSFDPWRLGHAFHPAVATGLAAARQDAYYEVRAAARVSKPATMARRAGRSGTNGTTSSGAAGSGLPVPRVHRMEVAKDGRRAEFRAVPAMDLFDGADVRRASRPGVATRRSPQRASGRPRVGGKVDKEIICQPSRAPGPEDLATCDRWYADGVQLIPGAWCGRPPIGTQKCRCSRRRR